MKDKNLKRKQKKIGGMQVQNNNSDKFSQGDQWSIKYMEKGVIKKIFNLHTNPL